MISSSSSSSPSSSLISSSSFGAGGGGAGAAAFLGGAFANIAAIAPLPPPVGLAAGLAAAGLGSGLTSDLATGLNPANGPGPFASVFFGSVLTAAEADLAAGAGAAGGEGFSVTLLAGPSARLTSAHATALCLLSRSALGVSGGASKSSSVCLTLDAGTAVSAG